MDTEELLYDNRYHGFTLALATMYLTRAQKAEVYEIYDSAVAKGVAASDVISESLAIAGKYDIRCGVVTARALSLPPLIWGTAAEALLKNI